MSFKSIFKSIDPWILGLCRSYCHKHGWKYNTTSRLSKKSIFSSGYNPNSIKLRRSKSSSTKNLEARKKLKRKKRKKSKKPLINLNYSENPSQLSLQSTSLDSSSNINERSRSRNNLSMIRMLDESSSDSSASSNASECEDVDAEAETEDYAKLDSDFNPSNDNNKNAKERFERSECHLESSKLNERSASRLSGSSVFSPLTNVLNNNQKDINNSSYDKKFILERFKSLNLD